MNNLQGPLLMTITDNFHMLAKHKMQAGIFIQGADQNRYSSLIRSLQTNHLKNCNQYLTLLSDAFNLLVSNTIGDPPPLSIPLAS